MEHCRRRGSRAAGTARRCAAAITCQIAESCKALSRATSLVLLPDIQSLASRPDDSDTTGSVRAVTVAVPASQAVHWHWPLTRTARVRLTVTTGR